MLTFHPDFDYGFCLNDSEILILDVKEVSNIIEDEEDLIFSEGIDKVHTLEHKDGWTISAIIEYDYYVWIESFRAYHPKYGKIYGDLNNLIKAESIEAYEHFIKYHPIKKFDLHDI